MSSLLPADFCGYKLLVAGLPQSPWDRMCELTSHSQKAWSKKASLTELCLSALWLKENTGMSLYHLECIPFFSLLWKSWDVWGWVLIVLRMPVNGIDLNTLKNQQLRVASKAASRLLSWRIWNTAQPVIEVHVSDMLNRCPVLLHFLVTLGPRTSAQGAGRNHDCCGENAPLHTHTYSPANWFVEALAPRTSECDWRQKLVNPIWFGDRNLKDRT